MTDTYSQTNLPTARSRKRVLMVGYCFHPHGTMEERNGWCRAVQAANLGYDVTVLYRPDRHHALLKSSIPTEFKQPGSLRAIPVHEDRLGKFYLAHESTFYRSYRRWLWKAYVAARELHRETPFDLAHFVTLCGFREPGYVWKLGIPYVWGPIGGTQNFPASFLGSLDLWNRLRERYRSWLNTAQLRNSSSVRRAIAHSSAVLSATQHSAVDFKKYFGISANVELETGLDYLPLPERQPVSAEEPLRILWAGRLRAWKGFPILLHAAARIIPSRKLEIRVLGDGSCRSEWQALAKSLGLEQAIEWVPWPSYRSTLPHYSWAHVFAFTSLRDTSGTGLLESLAAGTPIIGLDHQGAHDVMTQECSLPIPVQDWDSTVAAFASALERLATDRQFWWQLSRGASRRALQYYWPEREDFLANVYQRALQSPALAQHLQPFETLDPSATALELARTDS